MGNFARYWLPVLLYVTLIFVVSSIPSLQPPSVFGTFSDKLPHALEYGLLGYLLGRAIRGTNLIEHSLTAGLVALLIGLSVGLADELYQANIPGRLSEPLDYAADATGLFFSILLFWMVRGVKRRRRARASRA